VELHHWAEAAALEPVAGAVRGDQSITFWARAIGAARGGKVGEAKKDIEKMETIHRELVNEKKTEFAEAVEEDRKQAAAWVAHAEGKNEEAIAGLRAQANHEDAVGEESTSIPARELLADLLLELNRPAEALAEYEASLKSNPNRFNGLYGAARAAEMAGKAEKANTYYAQLVKSCAGSTSDRPELSRAKSLLAKN